MNLIVPSIILTIITIGILVFSMRNKKNSLTTLLLCIVGMALLLLGIYLKDASMWSTFCIAFFVLGVVFFAIAITLVFRKKS
ncbi:MAG: hypothetical protein NC225_11105 [Clostridium sp.]|nr:hypothetical protein [Clostridium sp.]MCM1400013.1 hypothetical protein [Clostridium sp.]MCM1459784.1 hypothetical protein [Bacteroides sp.]